MPLTFTLNSRSPDDAALHEAAAVLRRGGIAVYPTETFYGLGVLFNNEKALERLFAAKGRRETKPVLLLIENKLELQKLTQEITPEALALAERWWPGPLTMLFKALPHLSPYLTGDEGKIGCRVSGDRIARRLVELAGAPITSTSANLAGSPSAASIADIPKELLDRVDVILDTGATPGGLASTLLDVTTRPFTVLREGAIASGQLLEG
jgi:L-threonylcarbamoyladenylate synthase